MQSSCRQTDVKTDEQPPTTKRRWWTFFRIFGISDRADITRRGKGKREGAPCRSNLRRWCSASCVLSQLLCSPDVEIAPANGDNNARINGFKSRPVKLHLVVVDPRSILVFGKTWKTTFYDCWFNFNPLDGDDPVSLFLYSYIVRISFIIERRIVLYRSIFYERASLLVVSW